MKIFTFLVEMCFGHSYRIAVYKFLKLANNIFFVFTPIKSSLHLRPLIQISHGLAVHTCARCRAKFFFILRAWNMCVCVFDMMSSLYGWVAQTDVKKGLDKMWRDRFGAWRTVWESAPKHFLMVIATNLSLSVRLSVVVKALE